MKTKRPQYNFSEYSAVRMQMRRIPKVYRELLEMKFWEDLDSGEIAKKIQTKKHFSTLLLSDSKKRIKRNLLLTHQFKRFRQIHKPQESR